VLEIGNGSGYQAAVLSLLAREVYSIEIFANLAERAAARLEELGYSNVQVLVGDGSRGRPERAPFDRVLSTAATPKVPASWLQQLEDGGLLVAPVGDESRQRLLRFRKRGGRTTMEDLGWVAFVPLLP
jgi:protein-L-isoaspartate(D-aspartate) O-methyltransferase